MVFLIIEASLSFVAIITGLHAYLINPGTSFKLQNPNSEGQTQPKYYCEKCNFTYPGLKKELTHCYECKVCFHGHDHHCGVFGKCIAKKNLITFFIFPSLGSIIGIIGFISLIYYFVQLVKTKKLL